MPDGEKSVETRESFLERLLAVVQANTLNESEITSARIAHAMWARQRRAYGYFLQENLDELIRILNS